MSPADAGKFQAAFFTAAACALFYVWLRGEGVARAIAILFALLLGLNETALENATSVEVYGVSIFASVLALMAWSGVVARSGPRSSVKLFLACVLVGAFHLGFCFLPFAIYVSLAARERTRRRQLGWLLHGAGVLALLIAWEWIEGRLARGESKSGSEFFSILAEAQAPWEYAARVIIDPMGHWARYTGLILAAGALGMGLLHRARPEAWKLAGWATGVFFAFYILWVPDHGSFYYPLAPIWGLFGAMALQRVIARGSRLIFLMMLAGLSAWALLFMILPANLGPVEYTWPRVALGGIFWVVTLASWAAGRKLSNGKGEFKKPKNINATYIESNLPRAASKARLITLVTFSLALTAAAYYPNLIRFKQPEDDLRILHQFDEIAPREARLVGWFPSLQAAEASPREAISFTEMLANESAIGARRLEITNWLKESVGPDARPVYFDRAAWEMRDSLWGRYGGPNGIPLAYEDFKPVPRFSRREVFFELQWNPRGAPPGSDAALELYPVEYWGETGVQWTRRSARMWVEPRGRLGRLKYMVGHPDASPGKPVSVSLRVNGQLREEKVHTAPSFFDVTFAVDEATTAPLELRIDLNRFWLCDDGRELGLALFPIEFENPPR